ncbi:MAG: dephospho-CoA kinase [Candidatus Diapherotrites archaeon]|nr:dephospho-CoA kinase [Candidatus Diapherotrites archaeon]
MLRVALTGNIAMGKTTALNFFSELGLATIDSDEIVAEFYKKPKVAGFLRRRFGTTQKAKIAEIVFCYKNARDELEKFLHPMVFEEIETRISKLKRQGKKLVVVDIPLLFETNSENNFGKVVVVYATQPQQVYRLQKRRHSVADAFHRINAQAPIFSKLEKADFVIDNSKRLADTKRQVKRVAKKLAKLAEKT